MANNNKSSQVKIALLVLLALGILLVGFNFLKGNKLFGQEKEYHSVFNSAKGLKQGDKVVLLGVGVGKVKSIEFIDNFQKVKVSYTIDDHVILPQDSEMMIDAGVPGFGSPALKVNLGKSSSLLPSGSQVKASNVTSLTDRAGDIVDKVEPTVDNLNTALGRLDSVAVNINTLLTGQNARNIENSLASLNTTLANFNTTSKRLSALVETQSPQIEGTLANLNALSNTLASNQTKINQIVDNLAKTSNSVAKLDVEGVQSNLNTTFTKANGAVEDLQVTLKKANTTFAQLNSILAKVENGDGTLSLLLNNAELYNNLNDTARDLDRLLLDLQENPKHYVPNVSVFEKKKKRNRK